jgi:ABC-type multidrug transport system fused ATPase/permease subunit
MGFSIFGSINVHWIREHIVLVGQKATLFPCTIAQNIAMVKPDATFEQIVEAAKLVGLLFDAHWLTIPGRRSRVYFRLSVWL